MDIPLPLNAAHQHAASADDYYAQGRLVPAAEEHFKAAEAYLAAIDRASDENVKRTLRMLFEDHTKAGKDLERRISKLREEGKDPNVPQRPELPRPSTSRSHVPNNGTSGGISQAIPSVPSHRPVSPPSDVNNGVDESFMLLAGTRSDPGDAFNQFWNIMQGMLDNLSQPVAFATAPLNVGIVDSADASPASSTPASRAVNSGKIPRDGSLSSDTDLDEPVVSWMTKKLGFGGKDTDKTKRSNLKGSSYPPKPSSLSTPVIELRDDGFEEDFDPDELSGSFYLIPGSESSPAKLKQENAALKTEMETLRRRLAATERVLQMRKEQDQQLKESIVMARREAQRAMGASAVGPSALMQRPGLDLNSLNLNVPSPIVGINPGREAQYSRRIKELEEENRATKAELKTVQAENEKNKALIVKFKQRWDKLKESAKKKKEMKAAVTDVNTTNERIVEEPEMEQEVDDTPA